MARRERGLFRQIFKEFVASLTPNFARRKLVGEDYFGTKYFEIPPRTGSTKRTARSFEPVNKDDFTQEIPAEWEAWLRYRRQEPPTKEELQKNYEISLMKKRNAKVLEETYTAKEEVTQSLPEPISQPLNTAPETPGGFKIYEEYKEFGINYKPKGKK